MSENPSTPPRPRPTDPNTRSDHATRGAGRATGIAAGAVAPADGPDVATDHVPGDPPVRWCTWRSSLCSGSSLARFGADQDG